MRTTLAAALAAAIGAAPVQALEFTILIQETPAELAARTDPGRAAAYWGAFGALAQAMQEAGVLKAGSPLQWGAAARTVSVREGSVRVAPGVDPAGGTVLGGWFLIDVPDEATALAWAARVPAATTGAVEVVPAFPAPAMR
jgi:hypothetical protein